MTIQEARQMEIEYCREHLEYFVDTYGTIEDKDNPTNILQEFKMWQAQRDALKSIAEHKLNIILKARQLGFSWLALHYAVWMMVTMEGRSVIALSQKEDDAKELVRRVDVILSAPRMQPLVQEEKKAPPGWTGATYTKTALEIKIKFPSGVISSFNGMASSPGAGRSLTANLIIFDEWAFQAFAREIYESGFPTINRPTGGQVIGLSTIARGSLFEELFTNPDNGYNKIFIPWFADPRRDQEWYERTKAALGDAVTAEYPATIEEALTVPGGSYFPEVNERNTISKGPLEGNVVRYVCIDYGLDMFSAHWVAVDAYGNAQIYREYDQSNLTISQAAGILKDLSEDEEIQEYLAPPDLWKRNQTDLKPGYLLWEEAGVRLTKVSNDLYTGCLHMKEWLKPRENAKSKMTILEGAAPNLYNCLKKIQKDKRRPNVYAKDPHHLTHDPDSLRYFCVYWTVGAEDPRFRKPNKWTDDMWEDYNNAPDDETREYLIKKYGEPA